MLPDPDEFGGIREGGAQPGRGEFGSARLHGVARGATTEIIRLLETDEEVMVAEMECSRGDPAM